MQKLLSGYHFAFMNDWIWNIYIENYAGCPVRLYMLPKISFDLDFWFLGLNIYWHLLRTILHVEAVYWNPLKLSCQYQNVDGQTDKRTNLIPYGHPPSCGRSVLIMWYCSFLLKRTWDWSITDLKKNASLTASDVYLFLLEYCNDVLMKYTNLFYLLSAKYAHESK